MRYSVILIPEGDSVSALVPAMPGCFSQGRSRREALANVREAMAGWIEVEAERGRAPLRETPELVLESLARALELIDEARSAGEIDAERGYELEIASVDFKASVAA